MILQRICLGVALVFIGSATAFADDSADAVAAPATGTPLDPQMIRLHLMDGSIIAGKLSVKELELQTSFGMLKVPIESIRSFTPGLGSHPELSQRVNGLIEKLGSKDYDEREQSQKDLLKMGEQVRPQLEQHVADGDKERRERIKAILETLDDARDDEEETTPQTKWLIPHDSVETTEFTAIGKIITPQFTIDSNYGPLTVKLSDVRRGERDSGAPPRLEKSLTVDGSNIVHRGMKDTGLRVARGDKITISAEGSIGMTPWGNNMFSTPDGGGNFGWLVQREIPGGMLVATIGSNNQYLKVGSRATIRATRSGRLQLGVAMQQDYANQEFPGGYEVKIVIERPK